MTLDSSSESSTQLDVLLARARAREISENEFISLIRRQHLSAMWVEPRLRDAYSRLDWYEVTLLLDCVAHPDVRRAPEASRITRLLCEIMENAKTGGGEVEAIADELNYLPLDNAAVQSLVGVCTSPRWAREGWPDLRKAVEAIFGAYRSGVCTREELVTALIDILTSSNTVDEDCGLRDAAVGFSRLVK